ncbi:hypothetical protein CORC01_09929 [Colletotrichum orchidophilum]|uniref:Uncharacterized protein n=1 Tax=Colletotrichum orchidophilum TaxID=1209926 RepID=A0A1G4B0J1_9PEZI|nr:uncharacterized protein CORC01_09929 [Colletotrichum orchidophilum]OHE94822.1 hypothetical protein CORC01_09929 [Colletotrichum orchidophilum]
MLCVITGNPPAEVAIVLSIDMSCFVACSRIFCSQSPLAATSRPFRCRINAEDSIVPIVTSASASGRDSINLVLFSKLSFSLLLIFANVRSCVLKLSKKSAKLCISDTRVGNFNRGAIWALFLTRVP